MNDSEPKYNLKETEETKKDEPLDKEWYEKLSKLGIPVLKYLYPNISEKDKESFLIDHKQIPNFEYTNLDIKNLENAENGYLELKKDIASGQMERKLPLEERNDLEVARQAYRWQINEKIAEVRMLKAVSAKDYKRFKRYNEFIYGKPSPEIYNFAVGVLQEKIDKIKGQTTSQEILKAANDLEKFLPEVPESKTNWPPQKDVFDKAKEATMREFGDILPSSQEEKNFNIDEMVAIFDKALTDLNLAGWQVVKASDSLVINVSQTEKQVKIPINRQSATIKEIQDLVVHEIGTHVLSRENGEKNKTFLLPATGLDRYGKGHEGIATMRGHVMEKNINAEEVYDKDLAIAMVYGLDNKKTKDFSEIYDFLEKFHYFEGMIDPKNTDADPDLTRKISQEKAWTSALRIFRGTDGKTPGACYLKDTVYTKGNLGVWEVIAKNGEEMIRFSLGKYDPANDRHIIIMNRFIGISDKDLGKLNK